MSQAHVGDSAPSCPWKGCKVSPVQFKSPNSVTGVRYILSEQQGKQFQKWNHLSEAFTGLQSLWALEGIGESKDFRLWFPHPDMCRTVVNSAYLYIYVHRYPSISDHTKEQKAVTVVFCDGICRSCSVFRVLVQLPLKPVAFNGG